MGANTKDIENEKERGGKHIEMRNINEKERGLIASYDEGDRFFFPQYIAMPDNSISCR